MKEDIDLSGTKWSPETIMFCPLCHEKNTFYVQMRDNKCGSCRQRLPFPTAMAKDVKKRVEYHLGIWDN
jgi:hypothetical protein